LVTQIDAERAPAQRSSEASTCERDRLRFIAKVEHYLGLHLVAVDPIAKDIVYGTPALQLVAGA
jgi:hypothetical protein